MKAVESYPLSSLILPGLETTWTTSNGMWSRIPPIFLTIFPLVHYINFGDIYSFSEISNYIDKQFDDVLAEESRIKRNPRFTDNRVHALLYFIVATSHGLREQDVEFMKLMSTKVNIIPVISKSDTLTIDELELNKKIIMEDIKYYNIPIYNFLGDSEGSEGDEEYTELNSYLQETLPFAIIGASEILDVGGQKVQARRFPWGIVDVNDNKYSDVSALREVLTRTHLSDLKDNTHFVLYENYRTDKLSKDLPGSVSATPNLDAETSKSHQFQPYPMPRMPSATGTIPGTDSDSGTTSLLAREEHLRAEEEKLRQIEVKVQNEIAQKRRELLAREQELKDLENKLKNDPDALKYTSSFRSETA